MSVPRVLRRRLAANDVADIWDYIAEDSTHPADAWVDRLDKTLHLLAGQPLMGRVRDELSLGLRSLPLGRYVVFHLPLDDGIDVVRVLHSARDVNATFGESPPT